MENKQKRNGLILSVLGVLGLVLITAGVTYAFFTYQKEGQTENIIRTGTLEFEYIEGTDQIQITDALPMSDADGSDDTKNPQKFTFTVTHTNTGSQPITYYVTARELEGSTLDQNQVKMYLALSQANGATTTVVNNAASPVVYGSLNETATSNVSYLPQTYGSDIVERILAVGTVSGASGTETESYTFKMWLNGATGAGAVDYSPYEFVAKSASGATASETYTFTTGTCTDTNNQAVTAANQAACTALDANNTWTADTITVPKSTNTSALSAEDLIASGDLITSQNYYALPATGGNYVAAHCSDNTNSDQTTCLETSGNTWVAATGSHSRDEYERIAYVAASDNTTAPRTIYTLSQAVALQVAASNSSFLDKYGNYALTGTAPTGYDINEQYYQLNGQEFKVKINVYANATVQRTNP